MASHITSETLKLPLREALRDSQGGKLMGHAVTLVPCGHTFDTDTIEQLAQPMICPIDQKHIEKTIPCQSIATLAALAQTPRDRYIDLVLELLQHPTVNQDNILTDVLTDTFNTLKDQKSQELSLEQQGSYRLTERVLRGEEISQSVVEILKITHANKALAIAEDYLLGQNGKPSDPGQGVIYIRKSANLGNPTAQFYMGCLYDPCIDSKLLAAIIWLFKGSTGQLLCLIAQYKNDHDLNNASEACSWYRRAADQENDWAQYFLGMCYSSNGCMGKNIVEQLKWIRKASDQEHVPAQCSLGLLYYEGEGVEKNLKEAAKWFRAAALQGLQGDLASIYCLLGDCCSQDEGLENHLEEAFWCYQQAANRGIAEGQYQVARCLAEGQGVEQNLVDGISWCQKAAAQGHKEASRQILLMLGYGVVAGVLTMFTKPSESQVS